MRLGRWFMTRAHPRSRGENQGVLSVGEQACGSSPLTRGKPRPQGRQARRQGLIPAHAGKTQPEPGCEIALGGSSPLTRGKLGGGFGGHEWWGLIPAHAGKTTDRQRLASCPRAHPRSRGENFLHGKSRRATVGSSPLTRGKQLAQRRAERLMGLIPAHAGKTTHPRSPRRRGRAHPRSRGENLSSDSRTFFRTGSSPLTRGKLIRRDTSERQRGLIPAHAGKT